MKNTHFHLRSITLSIKSSINFKHTGVLKRKYFRKCPLVQFVQRLCLGRVPARLSSPGRGVESRPGCRTVSDQMVQHSWCDSDSPAVFPSQVINGLPAASMWKSHLCPEPDNSLKVEEFMTCSLSDVKTAGLLNASYTISFTLIVLCSYLHC